MSVWLENENITNLQFICTYQQEISTYLFQDQMVDNVVYFYISLIFMGSSVRFGFQRVTKNGFHQRIQLLQRSAKVKKQYISCENKIMLFYF